MDDLNATLLCLVLFKLSDGWAAFGWSIAATALFIAYVFGRIAAGEERRRGR